MLFLVAWPVRLEAFLTGVHDLGAIARPDAAGPGLEAVVDAPDIGACEAGPREAGLAALRQVTREHGQVGDGRGRHLLHLAAGAEAAADGTQACGCVEVYMLAVAGGCANMVLLGERRRRQEDTVNAHQIGNVVGGACCDARGALLLLKVL